MTLKSASGLMAVPILRARFQVPARWGATRVEVDSAALPWENVATAPLGSESDSMGAMGVPAGWMLTLSFPLSPRALVASAESAASVRYATEGADPLVSALAMVAVAGVSPPTPAARARAIDHDQPTANTTSTTTQATLKMRSALPIGRRKPRSRSSGNASSRSSPVALGCCVGELERLSSILPRCSHANADRLLPSPFQSPGARAVGGTSWSGGDHFFGNGAAGRCFSSRRFPARYRRTASCQGLSQHLHP